MLQWRCFKPRLFKERKYARSNRIQKCRCCGVGGWYDDALPWRYDTSGRDGDVVDRESAVSSAEIASLPVDWSLSMPASYLFGLFDSRSGDEDGSSPKSVNFIMPATILFLR